MLKPLLRVVARCCALLCKLVHPFVIDGLRVYKMLFSGRFRTQSASCCCFASATCLTAAQDRSKQQQEFLKDRKISKFFKKEHTIREIFKKIGLKILN